MGKRTHNIVFQYVEAEDLTRIQLLTLASKSDMLSQLLAMPTNMGAQRPKKKLHIPLEVRAIYFLKNFLASCQKGGLVEVQARSTRYAS